jgi:hypothetical protein
MVTETLPAVPARWELAAENIAVKKQGKAKNPWISRGFTFPVVLTGPPMTAQRV